MTAPTAVVWRGPTGRLHNKRGCSGRTHDAVEVRITEAEYEHALNTYEVCRCLRWARPEFSPEEEK